MHLVGYFEGIDSERGLEWRCSDSLSLREFLRLGTTEPVPDHSWLSKTRARLPLEVHEAVFGWVLQRLAEHGLIKGERIGVDASTMEANAALRTIVRRDSGEGYREMLKRLAVESGIETPTADDLIRLDRKRKGKRLSNEDWTSPIDPEARIAKLKDGRTHLAYKPEHAVDLDTGAIVAAADPRRRSGRHHDPAGDAEGGRSQPGGGRRRPDGGGAGRAGGRQGVPLARWPEGPGRWGLEEPHRREEAAGCLPLARRRGGAAGGLQQPCPAALRRGQGGLQAPGRAGRAQLRS